MQDSRHEKLKQTKSDSFFSTLNLSKYICQKEGHNRNRKVFANGKEVEVLQISPITSYWINGEAYHICELRYKAQID